MLHEDGANGVYLFGFDTLEDDDSCLGDDWFATVDEAKAAAAQAYGVMASGWESIADPLEHCQQDWIEPVRVKGRDVGNPQWGQLEKLVDGHWIDLPPK